MDRIFKYFNTESADDIDLEEWIVGFNVILKGSQVYHYYMVLTRLQLEVEYKKGGGIGGIFVGG